MSNTSSIAKHRAYKKGQTEERERSQDQEENWTSGLPLLILDNKDVLSLAFYFNILLDTANVGSVYGVMVL